MEWRRRELSRCHYLITRNLLISCCAECSQTHRCSASLHLITPKTKTAACSACPPWKRMTAVLSQKHLPEPSSSRASVMSHHGPPLPTAPGKGYITSCWERGNYP